MAAYEMKDGTGTIFPNKYHEEGDTKPHWKGEVMWRGEKIEIAMWPKRGTKGEFLSAKLQEPREKPVTAPQPVPVAGRRTDLDDEIPFAPEVR
jgi:hypothetical protein